MDQTAQMPDPMQSHLLKVDLEHTASHLAKAQGIMWNFVHFHRLLSHSFCIIPNDILTAYKLTQEDIVSGRFLKDDEKLQRFGHCVLDLNAIATGHLDKVEKEFILKPIAKNSSLRPLFLPYVSVRTKARFIMKDPLVLIRQRRLTPLHYPVSSLVNYFKAARFSRWP